MKHFTHLLIVFSALFMLSCEREVDLNLPESEANLVVEGYIENDEYPFVQLSNTLSFFGILDEKKLLNAYVDDAEVFVSNSTTKIQLKGYAIPVSPDITFKFFTIDTSIAEHKDFVGVIGETYDLEILYKGQKYVATTYIPQLNLGLDSFKVEVPEDEEALKENPNYRRLVAKYADPAEPGNMVRYLINVNNRGFYSNSFSVMNDEVTNGITTDKSFIPGINNYDSAYSYYRPYFELGDSVQIKWSSIDKGVYDFYRTLEFTKGTVGNPFITPTKVESNIKGGALGVWAGYGAVYHTVYITD